MLEIIAPGEYEQAMQEIIESMSGIPVTDDNFHDTLTTLLGDIRRGAKDGLGVTVCTFAKDGARTHDLFMPEDSAIKTALRQDDTALMVSDKNGAVFCLSYVKVGDKEYLLFMNPEAARVAANEERDIMNRFEAPPELSLFERICDSLSRFFFKHPTEAGARRDAYFAFYENMRKSAEQMDYMTQTQFAHDYDYFRQYQINEQVEAKRQAEELRIQQEEESQRKAEQERLLALEKARLEEIEKNRRAQFENLDKPEEPLPLSKEAIEQQKQIEEEEKEYENQRSTQVRRLYDTIGNAEREIMQLPDKILVYDKDILKHEESIQKTSARLILNQEKEKKLSEQCTTLKSQISKDHWFAIDQENAILNMEESEDGDRSRLKDDYIPVEQTKQELQNAQNRLAEIEQNWQNVEDEYSLMQMEPKAYLQYQYDLAKETRVLQHNDRMAEMDSQIGKHEIDVKNFKAQIKKLNKKTDAQKIESLKNKQTAAEEAIRDLKNKRAQTQKNFDEIEKEHKKEFLSPTTEKLEETAQFLQDGRDNYLIEKSKREAARMNVNDMTEGYQKQVLIYQEKQNAYNKHMEENQQQKEEMRRQANEARVREAANKKVLEGLEKEYNTIVTQNQKDVGELKFLNDQLNTFKQFREVLVKSESTYRTKLEDAKKKLQQMGEPVPGEEKEAEKGAAPQKVR